MADITDEKYPGNPIGLKKSQPAQERPIAEPKPAAKPVVQNPVTRRKKSLGMRMRDTFFGETARNVGDYIVFEILVPALKATVDDMITGGTHRMLYGDSRPERRDRRDGRSYVSYNSIYDRDDRRRERDREPVRVRSQYDFTDIIFATRADANEVLENLLEAIENYTSVSVADFYGFVDMEAQHTDYKYGWKNLASADIRPVRDGFVLLLPNPKPID